MGVEPVVLLVKVWYRPVFKCADCGVTQAGGTAEVSCDTLEGARGAMRPVPNHMPVGWASYLENRTIVYRCPRHVR